MLITSFKVKNLNIFIGAALMLVLVISSFGCAPSGIKNSVMDYTTLLSKLRDSDASVTEDGEARSHFAAVEAKVIKVNGGSVQVYEYETPQAMQSDTTYISSDGFTINSASISWIGPPHLYKSGRVFVTYIGKDETIINLLVQILGSQFAGL
jgi:hypothetical protein